MQKAKDILGGFCMANENDMYDYGCSSQLINDNEEDVLNYMEEQCNNFGLL